MFGTEIGATTPTLPAAVRGHPVAAGHRRVERPWQYPLSREIINLDTAGLAEGCLRSAGYWRYCRGSWLPGPARFAAIEKAPVLAATSRAIGTNRLPSATPSR